MKVLLVDDERNGRIVLRNLLTKVCKVELQIVEANSVDTAKAVLKETEIDVIFLDVQMPKKNGFELLKDIDVEKYQIIFVTAHAEFAVKAFEFSAVHYLLKPVSEEDLSQALERLEIIDNITEKEINALELNLQNPHILLVSDGAILEFIDIKDVSYLKADSSYCYIYLNTKKQLLSTKSLGYYDQLLLNEGFIRVHNSYLININYINAISLSDMTVVLKDGYSIPLSFRKKKQVIDLLEKQSLK